MRISHPRLLFVGCGFVVATGCASTPTPQSVDSVMGGAKVGVAAVPALYAPTATPTAGDNPCDAIDLELAGFGGMAVDEGVAASPSPGQRAGAYARSLASQTVLGYVQPVLQTTRALRNADEKERQAEQLAERRSLRRAYLTGLSDAFGCHGAADDAGTPPGPEVPPLVQIKAEDTTPLAASPDPVMAGPSALRPVQDVAKEEPTALFDINNPPPGWEEK